jgi:rRNA maturation RNase YbeY
VPIRYNYLLPFKVPQALKFKKFIAQLIEAENKELNSIDYIFCSDEYLLEINKEFLQHDFLTDIITFDLSVDASISSEIYVSIDRVRENAKLFNTSLNRELYRVMIHGALHLLGYKDKTKREIAFMRNKEEHYLLLFEKL